MQIIFIFVSILGLLYFSFAKRIFDFFSLAYISACIYFIPGFFGYALKPIYYINFDKRIVPLLDETYSVMLAALLAILCGAIFFDFTARNRLPKVKLIGCQHASKIAVGVSFLGLFMTIITTGKALLYSDKNQMMAELNRWYIIWSMGASVGAVLSFARRKWIACAFCIILLLFDLYMGFRKSLAITTIAIFTLWLSSRGQQRLVLKNWRVCIVGISFALSFFVYKFLYVVIKLGDWQAVLQRLKDPSFYLLTIYDSEPFITQVILNEVIRTDFRVNLEHLGGIIYQFMLFAPQIGAKPTSFNDLFQPALFPDVKSGMANNIWAQMWSSGGWILLACFMGIFITILFWGSYWLQIRDPIIKGGVVLLFTYWAFYIHRNDIAYQINLEKRVFMIWIFCVVFSMLINCISLGNSYNKYDRGHHLSLRNRDD